MVEEAYEQEREEVEGKDILIQLSGKAAEAGVQLSRYQTLNLITYDIIN